MFCFMDFSWFVSPCFPLFCRHYIFLMFTVIFWNPFCLDNHLFKIKHREIFHYNGRILREWAGFVTHQTLTTQQRAEGHISKGSRASMGQIPNLAQFVFIPQRQLPALEMCWTLFIETESCRGGMPLNCVLFSVHCMVNCELVNWFSWAWAEKVDFEPCWLYVFRVIVCTFFLVNQHKKKPSIRSEMCHCIFF